jgi:hypothetical protein
MRSPHSGHSRQTPIAIAHENSPCSQATTSDCASKPCEREYDVNKRGHTRARWASVGGIRANVATTTTNNNNNNATTPHRPR